MQGLSPGMVSARELKRQVRDSARRKREEEERAKRQSLSSSIDSAVERVEEHGAGPRRRWRDLALPLGALALAVALGGGIFLGVHLLRTWSGAHRSAWALGEATPAELLAVEEHVRKAIVQAQVGKLADEQFHPAIAPYWREKAQRILAELAQGRGVIEDVAMERRTNGDEARFRVYCRSEQGGGAMILLGRQDGRLAIVQASKIW